jgi:hypothetical protein
MLCPPLVLRFTPLRGDESLMLEAIQRGIERALLNLQTVLRDLLNAEQDAVAVQRSQRDRP